MIVGGASDNEVEAEDDEDDVGALAAIDMSDSKAASLSCCSVVAGIGVDDDDAAPPLLFFKSGKSTKNRFVG